MQNGILAAGVGSVSNFGTVAFGISLVVLFGIGHLAWSLFDKIDAAHRRRDQNLRLQQEEAYEAWQEKTGAFAALRQAGRSYLARRRKASEAGNTTPNLTSSDK